MTTHLLLLCMIIEFTPTTPPRPPPYIMYDIPYVTYMPFRIPPPHPPLLSQTKRQPIPYTTPITPTEPILHGPLS